MATETDKTEKGEKIPDSVKFVCPFNVRMLGPQDRKPADLVLVPRIGEQVKVDKETFMVSPVVDMIDLDAEIQTYKGMCGLEYFKLMLQQGKVTAESARDDGLHSVVESELPKTIHEAGKASDGINVVISEVAKQLGIKEGDTVSQEKLIELLSVKVAANLAAKPGNPGEGDK